MPIQRVATQALQKALYARLTSILVVNVYDSIPDNHSFPYVIIGNDTAVNFNSKTSNGNEITLSIHIWSTYHGNKEIQDIIETITESITANRLDTSADNFIVIEESMDFVEIFRQADGETRQGVLRFRFLIEDTT